MENQKNDNLNLLEAVVQNTEMGKNTLEQIVPMTDDVQFKAELLRQRQPLGRKGKIRTVHGLVPSRYSVVKAGSYSLLRA